MLSALKESGTTPKNKLVPSAGASFQLVVWMEDFFAGWTQKAAVDGEGSSELAVTSSVLQWSDIGPTTLHVS